MSTELLELAASRLGRLTEEMVFIGGATIHLWITEPTAPPTRATEDVDAICDVASLIDYYRLGGRLRALGFSEAMHDPIICRWRHLKTGLVLDVMPTLMSVDLHDVMTLIDGRPELTAELAAQTPPLRAYVLNELVSILQHYYFDYLAQSVTNSYGRIASERADLLQTRVKSIIETLSP